MVRGQKRDEMGAKVMGRKEVQLNTGEGGMERGGRGMEGGRSGV